MGPRESKARRCQSINAVSKGFCDHMWADDIVLIRERENLAGTRELVCIQDPQMCQHQRSLFDCIEGTKPAKRAGACPVPCCHVGQN